MDNDELLRREIRRLTYSNIALILTIIIAIFIFVRFVLILSVWRSNPGPESGMSFTQTASPHITTNLQAPDKTSVIKSRALTRGYYYKDEFAELMDVSERQVDRWRESGRLVTGEDEEGRVTIPLDVALSK